MAPVKNFACCVGVLILLFVGSSLQDCGERLDKGSVLCMLGPKKNYYNFDFKKCTHAALHIATSCENNQCSPNTADFDELVGIVQPHYPTNLGMFVYFNADQEKIFSSQLVRYNTVNAFIKFMEERELSFIIFSENTQEDDHKKTEDRNTLLFLEELAKPIHDRGWHIGLSIDLDRSELSVAYNFSKLSQFMDWFTVGPRKMPSDDQIKTLEPFYPLSLPDKTIPGTAEYWFRHLLQWVKPECLVLDFGRLALKYTGFETAVEPGLYSQALPLSLKSLYNSEFCSRLSIDSKCHEYWDDESSTPWATCGDEFYTYHNPRSIGLQVDLARQYNFTGVLLWNTDAGPQNSCGERERAQILRALQRIRIGTN